MLEDQPHRTFPHFRGIPFVSVHDSILSKNGASGKAGAVQQNSFEGKMEALSEYDLGNDRWRVITEQLDRLIQHKQRVEYQVNYLEALEFSVNRDFSAVFENGDQALKSFREMAAQESIKKATKALAKRPEEFGSLQDISLDKMREHIKSAVVDASKTHYLKTRVENAVKGLEIPEGMINRLQKEKLEYLRSVSDEKLALLRDVQLAANKLDDNQRKALDPEAKHAIVQARALMKDRDKRKLADELIKQQREYEEAERIRSLELKREIDPPK